MCTETEYNCESCKIPWTHIDRCKTNPNQPVNQCPDFERDIPTGKPTGPGVDTFIFTRPWSRNVACEDCLLNLQNHVPTSKHFTQDQKTLEIAGMLQQRTRAKDQRETLAKSRQKQKIDQYQAARYSRMRTSSMETDRIIGMDDISNSTSGSTTSLYSVDSLTPLIPKNPSHREVKPGKFGVATRLDVDNGPSRSLKPTSIFSTDKSIPDPRDHLPGSGRRGSESSDVLSQARPFASKGENIGAPNQRQQTTAGQQGATFQPTSNMLAQQQQKLQSSHPQNSAIYTTPNSQLQVAALGTSQDPDYWLTRQRALREEISTLEARRSEMTQQDYTKAHDAAQRRYAYANSMFRYCRDKIALPEAQNNDGNNTRTSRGSGVSNQTQQPASDGRGRSYVPHGDWILKDNAR